MGVALPAPRGDLDQRVAHAAQGLRTATFWDPIGGIQSLTDVLVNDFGLDLGGVQLRRATYISDDGLIIAGRGFQLDTFWVADLTPTAVPTVSRWGLVGLAVVLLLLGGFVAFGSNWLSGRRRPATRG